MSDSKKITDLSQVESASDSDLLLLDTAKGTKSITASTLLAKHGDVSVSSEDGAHGIRYYNNELAYNDGENWNKIKTGGSAVIPGDVTNITAKPSNKKIILTWTDPEDVIISGAYLCRWAGTKVVYKEGSYPTSPDDGTLVIDSQVRNQYASEGLEITGLTNGVVYYIALFPYSTDDAENTNETNRTSATPAAIQLDNCTSVSATKTNNSVTITWTDPAATKNNGDYTASWAKTVLVYKEGSYPTSINDGVVAVEETTHDKYSSSGYTISGLNEKTRYYFSLFPVSTDDIVTVPTNGSVSVLTGGLLTVSTSEASLFGKTVTATSSGGVSSSSTFDNEGQATIITAWLGKTTVSSTDGDNTAESEIDITSYADSGFSVELAFYELYGFKIEKSNSNPANRVTYLSDCKNASYSSAYMDYTTGKFNYGSWADAFFIKNLKPCMLKYNGTVDYELNPDDYSKKKTGGSSDISNTSYEGNAMVGFPTIWFKTYESDGYQYCYICSKQLDSSYKAYAHMDSAGNIMPFTYLPIYNGSLISSKVRSLSGQTIMNTQTGTNEITYAKANNLSGSTIWYTELLCDRIMVNHLLTLIGKSTNTQTVFGNGYYTGGSSASNLLQSGTMDAKGLFYGTNGTGVGVKVFGIENWWGNQWRRIGGWINSNGTQKVKLTYGTQDGSTTTGYNTDGTGYISLGLTPGGTSGGYISASTMNAYGLFPQTASGSDSTYECDGLWFSNSQVDYACGGGCCGDDLRVGAFCSSLNVAVSHSGWSFGASLSCKPLSA
jgi:hypothetical protein